jgi:hypothetical protein
MHDNNACPIKLGYLPDVSDDDAGCHVSKRLLRFFFGSRKRPHLMASLMKECGPGYFLKALCCL